jgi:hypothetical protein
MESAARAAPSRSPAKEKLRLPDISGSQRDEGVARLDHQPARIGYLDSGSGGESKGGRACSGLQGRLRSFGHCGYGDFKMMGRAPDVFDRVISY